MLTPRVIREDATREPLPPERGCPGHRRHRLRVATRQERVACPPGQGHERGSAFGQRGAGMRPAAVEAQAQVGTQSQGQVGMQPGMGVGMA